MAMRSSASEPSCSIEAMLKHFHSLPDEPESRDELFRRGRPVRFVLVQIWLRKLSLLALKMTAMCVGPRVPRVLD